MFSSSYALCLGNLFARSGACRTTKLIWAQSNYKVKKIDEMHHHVKLDGIHKLADTNIGLQYLISTRIMLPLSCIFASVVRPLPFSLDIAQFQFTRLAPSPRIHVTLPSAPTISSDNIYIHTNGASEPMPTTTQVTLPVEDEVRDVMEEMLLALELIEEEEQEAVTAVPADPAASVSSALNNSAKKAVRWDDQIAFVKEYEVTVEERRYKRSLLNFINSKGPAPWSSPSHHPQRPVAQVMMPCCCSW